MFWNVQTHQIRGNLCTGAGWVAEPADFTAAWAGLSAQSAHCFALVWETEHLRRLNSSLLAFLASAVLTNP